MDVRFNTYYNSYNQYNKSNKRPQAFTGKEEAAERILNAAENRIAADSEGETN